MHSAFASKFSEILRRLSTWYFGLIAIIYRSDNIYWFLRMPLLCKALQIYSLFTLSKAFLKSMKNRCSEDLNSAHCSKMIDKVLMWSIDPDRKPACSVPIQLLRCSLMNSRIILATIFATAVSTQIPLQLLHSKITVGAAVTACAAIYNSLVRWPSPAALPRFFWLEKQSVSASYGD